MKGYGWFHPTSAGSGESMLRCCRERDAFLEYMVGCYELKKKNNNQKNCLGIFFCWLESCVLGLFPFVSNGFFFSPRSLMLKWNFGNLELLAVVCGRKKLRSRSRFFIVQCPHIRRHPVTTDPAYDGPSHMKNNPAYDGRFQIRLGRPRTENAKNAGKEQSTVPVFVHKWMQKCEYYVLFINYAYVCT